MHAKCELSVYFQSRDRTRNAHMRTEKRREQRRRGACIKAVWVYDRWNRLTCCFSIHAQGQCQARATSLDARDVRWRWRRQRRRRVSEQSVLQHNILCYQCLSLTVCWYVDYRFCCTRCVCCVVSACIYSLVAVAVLCLLLYVFKMAFLLMLVCACVLLCPWCSADLTKTCSVYACFSAGFQIRENGFRVQCAQTHNTTQKHLMPAFRPPKWMFRSPLIPHFPNNISMTSKRVRSRRCVLFGVVYIFYWAHCLVQFFFFSLLSFSHFMRTQ